MKKQYFGISFFISLSLLLTASLSTVFAQTTGPTVSITSPVNGSSVFGTIPIDVSASDSTSGVNRVVVQVNGSSICTDYSVPYSCNWTVPAGSGVNYEVKGWVIDDAGLKKSASVTVISQ